MQEVVFRPSVILSDHNSVVWLRLSRAAHFVVLLRLDSG